MKDVETLNKLTTTANLLAYIEKVKKEFLEKKNIKLNLQQIKNYITNFILKLGATQIYIDITINTIENYYNENGELKY